MELIPVFIFILLVFGIPNYIWHRHAINGYKVVEVIDYHHGYLYLKKDLYLTYETDLISNTISTWIMDSSGISQLVEKHEFDFFNKSTEDIKFAEFYRKDLSMFVKSEYKQIKKEAKMLKRAAKMNEKDQENEFEKWYTAQKDNNPFR